MATSVSTWAEFIAAYQNTDTIIELMADIDCNDNPPTASIEKPVDKTINGNGHTIYNISTGAVINNPIFRGAHNLIFNNCKLYNCYRIENQPIFWSSNTYRTQFNDCKVTGRGLTHISENCTFQRSSYSWQGLKAGGKGAAISLYNTWVKIEEVRAASTSTAEFGTCVDSYIEGSIGQSFVGTNTVKICNNATDCVINIETTANSSTPTIGGVTVFNKTKAPNFTDATGFIGVTDEQLKTAVYLQSIGFDIITE